MNRIEFFAESNNGELGQGVRPLEISRAENPVSCVTDAAVCLALAIERAAQTATHAAIQTPGRRAFAGHDQGGPYHRTDVSNSLRGRSAALSSAELIGIAGL